MAESFADIRSLTSTPFVLSASDQIVVFSCAITASGQLGVSSSRVLPMVVEMASISTQPNKVIIQSLNGQPIEVLENSAYGGKRLTIIPPFGTEVFEGTTVGVPSHSTRTSFQWIWGDGVDNSSNFTDIAALTCQITMNTTISASYSTLMGAHATVEANASAAAWGSTTFSSQFDNIFASNTTVWMTTFNDAASSCINQLDILADVLANVHIGASS